MVEEAGELQAVVGRCICQGIDKFDPKSGYQNRAWLSDEIADVITQCELAVDEFGLDAEAIALRIEQKKRAQRLWIALL